jgi:transmembrane sensor
MKKEAFIQTYGVEPELVAYWIAGVLRQVLRDEETEQLDEWIIASMTNQKLYEILIDTDRFEKERDDWHYETSVQELQATILAFICPAQRTKKKRALVIGIVSAAVAASVALLLFFNQSKTEKEWWAGVVSTPTVFLPGGDQVPLNEKGDKAGQPGLHEYTYEGKEGVVEYEQQLKNEAKPGVRIFKIPELWKYWLFLDDGTDVCLHNGAAIRYRKPFKTGQRGVDVMGEFYFEISHQPDPFTINFPGGKLICPGGKLYVYVGTDSKTRILLLEGQASVQSDSTEIVIQVGEMAKLNGEAGLVVKMADSTQYLTRKDGVVRFTNELTPGKLKENLRNKLRLFGN